MKKKILITPRSFSQSGEKAYRLLEEAGYEVTVNMTGKSYTEDQMIEYCTDVDGLIVGVDPVTERVLKSAKKLRAVSKYGAGLDNIDLAAANEFRIKVDRAAGTNAVSVAELAIGLMFVLARNIIPAAEGTKAGRWERQRGTELYGKTLSILGMGNIGREAARIGNGLGMEVIAYDPYIGGNDEFVKKYGVEMTDIENAIKNADFLTLHLPLTSETRYVINRSTLRFMKPSAYLINTSRGELVNEDDLYEALVSGVIAGAAEDVFSKEPPEGHKLLSLDKFILTSHMGAYTEEANEKMAVKSAVNLINMLQ